MKTESPINEQYGTHWLQSIVEPYPHVQGEEKRVDARLLTRVILAMNILTGILLPVRLLFVSGENIASQIIITLLILFIGLVCYFLARLGYTAMIMAVVFIHANATTLMILSLPDNLAQVTPLFFTCVPVILVSGFFRIPATLLIATIQSAVVLAIGISNPELHFNDVLTGPITFLFVLTMMLILLQYRRQNMEAFLNKKNIQSNQLYRIAAEGSLDPYYILENVYDEQGNIVDFIIIDLNSRAEQQLKISRNNAIGTRFFYYFPALKNVKMLERYLQVIETGETLVEDFELPLNDSESEWYHHQVVQVANGLAVTNRNITEQKAQAQELENRVQQLIGLNELTRMMTSTIDLNEVYWLIFEYFGKKLFNAQHMVIGIYNAQEQTISCAFRVNEGQRADPQEFPDIPIGTGPASQTVLTREPRTISSQEYYELYPDSVFKRGEKAIHSLLFLPLVINDQSLGYISIQHEEDNAFVNVDMALMMTVAGQAAIVIENARLFQQAQQQINIQKASEEALRSSRAEYQLLAETARDMILTHDLDGNLLYANQAFLKLSGYNAAEIREHNICEFFPDSSKLIWLQDSFKATIRDWEKLLPKTIEADMSLSDEVIPLEINMAVILEGEEKFQGMLLIARDITDRRLTEEALLNSEANFRSLAEFSPDAIYIFQLPDYNLLYFNHDTFLGYPTTEIFEYNSVLPYTHPDDYERVMMHRNHIKTTTEETMIDFEFRIRDSEDNWQWLQSREVVMERNQRGEPARIMVIFTIITERKEAEFELKRNEERWRAVINTQTEVISRYSIDLKLTFVNEAYKRAFGLEGVPDEAIIGRAVKDFIPQEQHDYIDQYHANLLTTLKPSESVHKTIAPDGSERWFRWKDQPILDREGNLIELQATGIDITEQRETEQALRRSDDIFRLITENVDDIFYVFDIKVSRITYISPSVENLWGMSVEDIYTNPYGYLSIVHPDDKEIVIKHTSLDREIEQGMSLDYRVIRPIDNTVCWIQVRDFIIKDEQGHNAQIVGIIKDITEERRINARMLEFAREQDRLKMLKQFVGDTSHDLMTPLSVIKTSLYLLNKAKDEESRLKRTAVINEQIEMLVEMIGDMLDMSRLDNPKTANYEFESTEINAFLETIVDYHRALALQSAHHIDVSFADDLPPIQCDQKKLHRAISNLISNALKYTPAGSQIRIGTYRKAGGIGITIADNGEGIPKEAVPRIFERFFRVEQHRPQGSKRGGTGLGLAITKNIIDGHGGTVTIESDLGKGTTFYIWLPLQGNVNSD